MNHPIPTRVAPIMTLFAGAILAVAGCGQAFSLTGGTSGSGGTSASSTAVTATAAASGTGGGGGAASTSSTSTSASTTATTSSGGPGGCSKPSDCGQGEFCLKDTCGSGGKSGVCTAVTGLHATYAPLCGCDGVTYWNSNYVKASPEPIKKTGPCGLGDKVKTCDATGAGCNGSGEHCALGRQNCEDALLGGTCWIVPQDCSGTSVFLKTCKIGSIGDCQSLCSLITEGQSFTIMPLCAP